MDTTAIGEAYDRESQRALDLARRVVDSSPLANVRRRIRPGAPIDSMFREGGDTELPPSWLSTGSSDDDGLPKLPLASVLIAELIAADHIASETAARNPRRAEKMRKVVSLRLDDLERDLDLASDARTSFNPHDALARIAADWDIDQATLLLIELASSDPFEPYELDYRDDDFHTALAEVATCISADLNVVEQIEDVFADARGAHHSRSIAKLGMWGLGGAVLLGGLGFAAAPLIGAKIGAFAGLSGAAATNAGLASLGGGALSSGGLGVNGGLWLIAKSAAATGAASSTAGALLHEMGSRQVRQELIKLQVCSKLLVMRSHANQALSLQIASDLHLDLEELYKQLEIEKGFNDDGASRIAELEDKIKAITAAINWVEQETVKADD